MHASEHRDPTQASEREEQMRVGVKPRTHTGVEARTDTDSEAQIQANREQPGPSVEPEDGHFAQSPVDETQPVDLWFAAVADRIEEAERFTGVDSVDEARDAIAAFGGIAAVRALDEQLAADRRQVEMLGERHSELQSRLATVDVPLSTLERLV